MTATRKRGRSCDVSLIVNGKTGCGPKQKPVACIDFFGTPSIVCPAPREASRAATSLAAGLPLDAPPVLPVPPVVHFRLAGCGKTACTGDLRAVAFILPAIVKVRMPVQFPAQSRFWRAAAQNCRSNPKKRRLESEQAGFDLGPSDRVQRSQFRQIHNLVIRKAKEVRNATRFRDHSVLVGAQLVGRRRQQGANIIPIRRSTVRYPAAPMYGPMPGQYAQPPMYGPMPAHLRTKPYNAESDLLRPAAGGIIHCRGRRCFRPPPAGRQRFMSMGP